MLELPYTIRRLVKKRHVVVLCVGSSSGDDAAGPILYKLVHSKLKNIKIVLGGSAPEKSLSQITAYKPDTVIMVNAVERKLLPGDVVIEDLREDHGSFPLMHKFPLSVLAQLITLDLGESTEVRLLGVQAKRLYGKVSKQVFETTASLARALIECDGLAVEAG